MSLCQCLTQCICVNVLLLQFDIIKLFICIGKIVTIKMFSCIHELSPYHYQLSSCHHQLSSWYILTCILDIYLDTISLNNYNQIDYALDLSPLNLTCCSQGQSRNKKLALSQSTRSPSGFLNVQKYFSWIDSIVHFKLLCHLRIKTACASWVLGALWWWVLRCIMMVSAEVRYDGECWGALWWWVEGCIMMVNAGVHYDGECWGALWCYFCWLLLYF